MNLFNGPLNVQFIVGKLGPFAHKIYSLLMFYLQYCSLMQILISHLERVAQLIK